MDNFVTVEHAYFHEACVSYPLPAERSLSQSKCPGIVMKWSVQGLYWSYKDRQGLIPAPAVACVVFSPEQPPAKLSKVAKAS